MTNVVDGQLDLLAQAPPQGSYASVEQAQDGAERGWWQAAWAELEACVRSGSEFTADDLRERVGEPDHSARWGALFVSARKAGLIETLGARPSSTPSRHGSLVRVWRGVQ